MPPSTRSRRYAKARSIFDFRFSIFDPPGSPASMTGLTCSEGFNRKSESKIGLLVVAAVRDLATFLLGAIADQATAFDRTMRVTLDFLLGLGRVAREWHGQQALLGDRLLGRLANAVGAGMDALDGGLDFGERLLLVGNEAEREVAVESIG